MTDCPLRILMLAPTPYFGDRGCHVRIYEEARTLIKRGHDVRIVTYHLGRDVGDIPTYRIPPISWYTKQEAGPSWFKPYLDILLYRTARRLAKSFQPQVIHAHLHEGALIGAVLSRRLGIPLVFDYQGSMTEECIDHNFFKPNSTLARIFSAAERTINRLAGHIVTSSTRAAERLVHVWGEHHNKVTPLIDGVDTDMFTPGNRVASRQQLDIPEDCFVVAYLGLLNRYQGTDLLLDAIERVQQHNHSMLFLIMGFPHQQWQEEAERRGISQMIRFTGKISYNDAPMMLAAADAAISPKISPSEANGKLLNYMAVGLPTVVFDTPVNRELLGDCGCYAPVGDVSALADLIMSLAEQPDELQRLADAVREKAIREHSLDARIITLEHLYFKLLGITGNNLQTEPSHI